MAKWKTKLSGIFENRQLSLSIHIYALGNKEPDKCPIT